MAMQGGPGLQGTWAGSSGVSTDGLCSPALLWSKPRSRAQPVTWNRSPGHQDENVGMVSALRRSRRPDRPQSRLRPRADPPCCAPTLGEALLHWLPRCRADFMAGPPWCQILYACPLSK